MDRPRVVLATTNKGKIAELNAMLSALGVDVIGMDKFPQIGEIEENGATFAENALLKARAVVKISGLVSIADDSGLMVDHLGGAPGIFSARFGQDWEALPRETRDERNIRKLLHLMANVPESQRGARFVTAMAAVKPDGKEIVTHGEWRGKILNSPQGHNGFGYDPVFFDPELGKSAALLSGPEKNARSHRGKAMRALLDAWPQFINA